MNQTRYSVQRDDEKSQIGMRSGRKFRVPEEAVAMLGTMTDKEVAQRFEIPKETIKTRRRSLGIAPYGRKSRNGIWTPGNIALLGTMTDHGVALAIGLQKASVGEKRRQLGIPAFKPKRSAGTLEHDTLFDEASDIEAVLFARFDHVIE